MSGQGSERVSHPARVARGTCDPVWALDTCGFDPQTIWRSGGWIREH